MDLKPDFNPASKVLERDWGTEEILIFSPTKWMMKKLCIKSSSKMLVLKHRSSGFGLKGHLQAEKAQKFKS